MGFICLHSSAHSRQFAPKTPEKHGKIAFSPTSIPRPRRRLCSYLRLYFDLGTKFGSKTQKKKGRPFPLRPGPLALGLLRILLASIGIAVAVTATSAAIAAARALGLIVVVAGLQVRNSIDGRGFIDGVFASRNDFLAKFFYPSRSIWG